MLKVIKDVTIRHDGREIHGKAGQIVNVKASFDINDDVARGVELRHADKFRKFVKLIQVSDKSKTTTLNTQPIHNEAEQKKRREDEEIVDVEEEIEEEVEEEPQPEPEPAPSKKGKGGKKAK